MQYIYETDTDSAELKRMLESDIENIDFHLDQMRKLIETWNTDLRTLIKNAIEAKQEKHAKNMALIDDLGMQVDRNIADRMLEVVRLPRSPVDVTHIESAVDTPRQKQYQLLDEHFTRIKDVLFNPKFPSNYTYTGIDTANAL